MSLVVNVFVDDLEDKINRRIVVNENISLTNFCESIIVSLNGKKIPFYVLRHKKKFYYPFSILENDDVFSMFDLTLKDFKLKKGNEFDLLYDYSNGTYPIVIKIENKIREDNTNDFEVLSGKGYGIIDDCGGIWGLEDIFSGENDEWGRYDINYFDLDECNDEVRKV